MLTETVARRVRQLRQAQRMSARRLSDLCVAAGCSTLTRTAIASLESGRRRSVSVEELVALAQWLNVAPVHLMEDPGAETIDPAPGALSGRAWRAWLTSRAPLPGQDPRIYEGEAVAMLADLPAVDEEVRRHAAAQETLRRRLLPPLDSEDEVERDESHSQALREELAREIENDERTRGDDERGGQ